MQTYRTTLTKTVQLNRTEFRCTQNQHGVWTVYKIVPEGLVQLSASAAMAVLRTAQIVGPR